MNSRSIFFLLGAFVSALFLNRSFAQTVLNALLGNRLVVSLAVPFLLRQKNVREALMRVETAGGSE
ncbi:MAG: hypothetical protein BSOLF_0259 [Candidatus Carbobacillus altaicus]|uniref:Uncharacterized protein n=1 Tax=Candidatus Carbonibacillus altaicus TaxID=2163959 RepID=A0A2R6Y180_9BACL|nr:MAG: hypothetical protein BSOLF_0259 [Candidatus Carbobacillus altaicus]